jgi:lipoprotein-releasing system permease protein
MRLAWTLAWSSFSRGQARLLWSSSLAMALGLVPLVVVLSIADGMIEQISARSIETAYYHVQLWQRSLDDWRELTPKLRSDLKTVPEYRGLWPEQQGFALGYSAEGRLGLAVRGIDPGWAADSGVARYLKATGTLTMAGPRDVWLGRDAARKLHLAPGDTLKLLTTRSRGAITIPRVTEVRVAAVVSVGYEELDKLWLFAPLDLTTQLFDVREQPVFWGIQADGPLSDTAAFTNTVRRVVGTDFEAASWETVGRSQFLNYAATRALLAVVLALILLVAAVNVSTAMVTTVAERRRETAILKALGASERLVGRHFLLLGLLSGLAGTALGLGLGMLAAWGVNGLLAGADAVVSLLSGSAVHLMNPEYYLETIPAKFDPVTLGAAAGGSLLLSVLFAWLPARRAAKERPMDALRRV